MEIYNSEQEQVEALKAWWDKNGRMVIAAIVRNRISPSQLNDGRCWGVDNLSPISAINSAAVTNPIIISSFICPI